MIFFSSYDGTHHSANQILSVSRHHRSPTGGYSSEVKKLRYPYSGHLQNLQKVHFDGLSSASIRRASSSAICPFEL